MLAKDPFESQVEMRSFRELISASKVVTVLKYTWIWDLCIIKHLKSELAPDSLCPTRWTVRVDSLASILSNYTALQKLWEKSVEIVKDSETIARINGVASQISTFTFLFGVELGEKSF